MFGICTEGKLNAVKISGEFVGYNYPWSFACTFSPPSPSRF
jgi:hypothetical protein